MTVNEAIKLSSFLGFKYMYTSSESSNYIGAYHIDDIVYDKLLTVLYERLGYKMEKTNVFFPKSSCDCWQPYPKCNNRHNNLWYCPHDSWNFCYATGHTSINGTEDYIAQKTRIYCHLSYLYAAITPFIEQDFNMTYTILKQKDPKEVFSEGILTSLSSYDIKLDDMLIENDFDRLQYELYIILSYILYCAEYGVEPTPEKYQIQSSVISDCNSLGDYVKDCIHAIYETFLSCSMSEYLKVLPIMLTFLFYPYGLAEIDDNNAVTFWMFINYTVPKYLTWRNSHTLDTPLISAMDKVMDIIQSPFGESTDYFSYGLKPTSDFFLVWYVTNNYDYSHLNPCYRLARDIWDTLYLEWEKLYIHTTD